VILVEFELELNVIYGELKTDNATKTLLVCCRVAYTPRPLGPRLVKGRERTDDAR
jgi:hypothetical protein